MAHEDDTVIAELAKQLQISVSGGDTVEGAARRLRSFGVPTGQVDTARLAYERSVGRIRDLTDPGSLVDREDTQGYWYGGAHDDQVLWPALRARLATGLGPDALRSVDTASDRIVGLMSPPGRTTFATRGLVLGYVQSGKTTSFMSVIAKAADVGYRLIVVLSGITDNLRSQTQERLDADLVGDLSQNWYQLTDADSDFGDRPTNAKNLLSRTDTRLIAVVKKNPYRLLRLIRWIDSAGPDVLATCPVLVVDDEADQASIDTGKTRRSTINRRIDELLNRPRAAYIAYSATPFANLLIDPAYPKGLYPKDFIVDLPRSPDYFGPERIFGRDPLEDNEDGTAVTEGMDIVRHVPVGDFPGVRPPTGRGAVHNWDPEIPATLTEAIHWFVLATAARRDRGTGNPHSTMLVHTSMLAEAHFRLAGPVRELLQDLHIRTADPADPIWAQLHALWDREAPVIPPDDGQQQTLWDGVAAHVHAVLADAIVVVDNYQSQDRLSYRRGPTTAVVVGGNTLSRGLTLEGLVCSYFVRTSTAYDSLLQMGRWFGYRKGYADLVRIWMPGELEDWFGDLATVEEEIRRDIRRYEEGGEHVTPLQLAVRIRQHPKMQITAAPKRRSAVPAQVSYNGQRTQTILFHHRDTAWLNHNLQAGRDLLAGLGAPGTNGRDDRPLYNNVPHDALTRFLGSYRFHDRARDMRPDLLTAYIADQVAAGHLLTWSVAVMEHPDAANGTLDLGGHRPVNLIERSRVDIPGLAHANIKSLVSVSDRVADLPLTSAQRRLAVARRWPKATGGVTDEQLREIRQTLIGPVGLLALYPISRDSQPRDTTPGQGARRAGERRRMPLEASQDVLGVCLFFPKAARGTGTVDYLAAPLEPLDNDEDTDDIDDIDRADEKAGQARSQQAATDSMDAA